MLLKLAGYLLPTAVLADPRVGRTTDLVTAGCLAALVVVQTVGGDAGPALDARVAALLVAAVALLLRAPFVVVVLLGAATAAGLRAAGIG
nr:AzlD domain-containing protein [Kineococcus siccus]